MKKLSNKHQTQPSIPVTSHNAFTKINVPDTVLDLREKDNNYFVTVSFFVAVTKFWYTCSCMEVFSLLHMDRLVDIHPSLGILSNHSLCVTCASAWPANAFYKSSEFARFVYSLTVYY